jgi:tungstate transport system ATP-binding protein
MTAAPRAARGLPIVLDHVAVERGSATLLRDVSLTLDAGGVTMVIGPNGSGKSTLLRVMHGLVAPTRGTITWGGESRVPGGQAMVFQRPILLRRSSAANVDYALRRLRVPRAERVERIARALAAAGLPDHAPQSARTLSGGEQQRLAVARAWATRPEVLFLDEPTASLDPHAKREVEALMADFAASGMTLVFASHNLGQVKRLATRVIYLEHGRILADLPVQAFFEGPLGATSREAEMFVRGELG